MTEEGLALLRSFVRSLGRELNDKQAGQFSRYMALLLDWNKRINLTAITEPAAIVVRHFCDSLSCSAVMDSLNDSQLVDVGSGAGFPGIPLKILFPGLRLTMVESVNKKAAFLEAIAEELKLNEVEIVHRRVEELGQSGQYRGSFDYAAARSVASMAVLMEYLLPLLATGGMAVAMKGPQAASETAEAAAAISILGGGEARLHKVALPKFSESESEDMKSPINHWLVAVVKVGSTPDKYPRRTGIPSKRPIGPTASS